MMSPPVEIQLLEFVDPSCFWFREIPSLTTPTPEAAQFAQLEQKIQHFYEDKDYAPNHIGDNGRTGMVCVGKQESDQKWYRVQIKDTMKSTRGYICRCLLLDYGVKVNIIIRSLCVIDSEFANTTTYPYQAQCCYLHDIRPMTMMSEMNLDTRLRHCHRWDTSVKSYIKKVKKDAVGWQLQQVCELRGKLYGRLYYINKQGIRCCLNDDLIEQKYATHGNPNSDSDDGPHSDGYFSKESDNESIGKRITVDQLFKTHGTETTSGHSSAASSDVELAALAQSSTATASDHGQIMEAKMHRKSVSPLAAGMKSKVAGRGAMMMAAMHLSPSPPSVGVHHTPADSPNLGGLVVTPKTIAPGVHWPEPSHQSPMPTTIPGLQFGNMPPLFDSQDINDERPSFMANTGIQDQGASPDPPLLVPLLTPEGNRSDTNVTQKILLKTQMEQLRAHWIMLENQAKLLENNATSPISQPSVVTAIHPTSLIAISPTSRIATSPVGQLQTFSTGHLAINTASHLTTYQAGHQATSPSGHQATSPSSHQASSLASRLATSPVGHQAITPTNHQVTSLARSPTLPDQDLKKPNKECPSKMSSSKLPATCGRGRMMAFLLESQSPGGSLGHSPVVNVEQSPEINVNQSPEGSTLLHIHSPSIPLPQDRTSLPSQSPVDQTSLPALSPGGSDSLPIHSTGGLSSLPVQSSVDSTLLPVQSPEGDTVNSQSLRVSVVSSPSQPAGIARRVTFSDSGDAGSNIDSDHAERKDSSFIPSCRVAGKHMLQQLGGSSHPKPQQKDVISPEMHNVKIFGQLNPKRALSPGDLPFDELLLRTLSQYQVKRANRLQMYMWPILLRGNDAVGVVAASASDTSDSRIMAYLAPILTNLRRSQGYSELPPGGSPRMVVLCPSQKRAAAVEAVCRTFVYQTEVVLMVFGGGADHTMDVPLLNGCDILVGTPHCMLRLLERQVITLDRLCHLILEDADVLTEQFPEELEAFMSSYNTAIEKRDTSAEDVPNQRVAVSDLWCKSLETFMQKHFDSPRVILASRYEAAFCGKVKQLCTVEDETQRLQWLLSHLGSSHMLKHHRVIVFVQHAKVAETVGKALTTHSIYNLVVHQELLESQLAKRRDEWGLPPSTGTVPVLVCQDASVNSMDLFQGQASYVIHLEMPDSLDALEARLWSMHAHYADPTQLNAVSQGRECISYFLAYDAAASGATNLVRLLRRCGSSAPPKLQHWAETQALLKEKESSQSQLCHFLKAFGVCRDENKCKKRHILSDALDRPPDCTLPMDARVTVLVTHVHDASHYHVRILDLQHRDGRTENLSAAFSSLALKMTANYSKPSQQCVPEMVEVGTKYAWKDTQHVYHRVEVLRLSDIGPWGRPDDAVVYFVDIGKKQKVKTEELFTLSAKFASIAHQAVETFVCRVKPVDNDISWSTKADTDVSMVIKQQEMVGHIVFSLQNTIWVDPLVLRSKLQKTKIIVNQVSTHQELMHHNIAELNPQHIRRLYALCTSEKRIDISPIINPLTSPIRAFMYSGALTPLQDLKLPDEVYKSLATAAQGECFLSSQDKFVKVVVSAVSSPDLFYLHIDDNISELENYISEIQQYVKITEEEDLTKLDVATLVLAKFSIDDCWFRGKVMKVLPDDHFDIFFLDYGDSEVVCRSDIRVLPHRFLTLPFQAVECSMPHLQALDLEFPESVGELLAGTTNVGNTVLSAKFIQEMPSRHVGRCRFGVELYKTLQEYDLELGRDLVAGGHARLTSSYAERIFGTSSEEEADNLARIPRLCAQILQLGDIELKVELAAEIQQILVLNLKAPELLLSGGVVRHLAALLPCSYDVDFLDLIITSVKLAVQHSDSNCIELQKCHGINHLCMLLDLVQIESVWDVVLWTMLDVLANPQCRRSILHHGGLRIISNVLTKATKHSILENASKLLHQICANIEMRDQNQSPTRLIRDLRVDTCCENLAAYLQNGWYPVALSQCLQCVDTLARQNQLKNLVRKSGCVKAICTRFDKLSSVELQCQALTTLRSCGNNNRFSKNVMLDLNLNVSLLKFAENGEVSEETRRHAAELAHRILDQTPSDRSSPGTPSSTMDSPLRGGPAPCSDMVIKNKPLHLERCQPDVPYDCVHPEVRWCQSRQNLLLTVLVKDASVHDNQIVKFEQNQVKFRAVVAGIEYSFNFALYELIEPSKCVWRVTPGNVNIGLRKASRGYWTRVPKEKYRIPYLQQNYERLRDSSEDELDDSEEEHPLMLAKGVPTPSATFGINRESAANHVVGLPPEVADPRSSDSDKSLTDDEDINPFRHRSEYEPSKDYFNF